MMLEMSNDTKVWLWWGGMVAFCGLGNLALLKSKWRKTQPSGPDKTYQTACRWLALPLVFECAWRSLFPSLYLQRFAFWDTPLNSIMVDRTWACVGELCWVFQITMILRHVDSEITGGQRWTKWAAWLCFGICVVAEGTSYYNVCTTNELWAAIEIWLWATGWLVMAPSVFFLLFKCPGRLGKCSAKNYLAILAVACLIYPYYNFAVDGPMYMKRYEADQANHKQYFGIIDGFVDACHRRIVTRSYEDWSEDMTWMVLYFLMAPISGIFMMYAPTVGSENVKHTLTGSLLSARVTEM